MIWHDFLPQYTPVMVRDRTIQDTMSELCIVSFIKQYLSTFIDNVGHVSGCMRSTFCRSILCKICSQAETVLQPPVRIISKNLEISKNRKKLKGGFMKVSKTSSWALENKGDISRIHFYLCDHKLMPRKDLHL